MGSIIPAATPALSSVFQKQGDLPTQRRAREAGRLDAKLLVLKTEEGPRATQCTLEKEKAGGFSPRAYRGSWALLTP